MCKLFPLVFFILANLPALICSGQDRDNSNDKSFSDRVFFGGNLGLQFGTYTFIDVSPLVGYEITEKLSAGVGFTYLYYKDRIYDYSTNIYGGRVFTRYNIIENFFAHGEYEILNLETFDLIDKRMNITNILVGGGYRQHIGGRTYFNLLVLWNINESAYSPYQNPIIRGGISFGI